jgi:hypothetical protein
MTPRDEEVYREFCHTVGIDPGPSPAGDAALSRTPTGATLPPSMKDLTGVSNRPPPHLDPNSPESGNPYRRGAAGPPPREEPHDLVPAELAELQSLLRQAAQAGPGAAAPWEARYASLTGEMRRLLADIRAALGSGSGRGMMRP